MAQLPRLILPSAFTADSPGRVSEIITPVGVSLPFLPNEKAPPDVPRQFRALWDTGATLCAITAETVKKVGLKPIAKAMVYHADGATEQYVYLLNLYLPNNFIIPMVRATECKSIGGNFDFIVGMDIITLGDFAFTNVGGKSVVSFRMPPDRKIDYVSEINELNAQNQKRAVFGGKVGRNDRCPCGSGRKYKYCHGS